MYDSSIYNGNESERFGCISILNEGLLNSKVDIKNESGPRPVRCALLVSGRFQLGCGITLANFIHDHLADQKIVKFVIHPPQK